MRTLTRSDVLAGTAVSVFLLGGSLTGLLGISLTEVLGFLTGGLSVWLVVKGNIWTWPAGIANNVWFVWIAVDLVYVPLYLSRELVLTAVLYAGFLLLCLLGLAEWRRQLDPGALPGAPVRLQEAA